MVTVERIVDRSLKSSSWRKAKKGDQVQWAERVRTGELSRAAIELSTGGVLRLSELTSFKLQPPPDGSESRGGQINFATGVAYFFSRSTQEADIKTPTASLSIRGTEFVVEVGANGKTTISMVEGAVEMSNEFGQINLVDGEQGVVIRGQAPRKTAVLDASEKIQWFLYYPGVADPEQFRNLAGTAWGGSYQAYAQGDVLRALELLPKRAGTKQQYLFSAVVKLASGRLDEVEEDLRRSPADPLVPSLRALIQVVKIRRQRGGRL